MSFLPFSAVVGQDDAKLALLLAACDPAIGGVLLRGDKGSAKTTLARGLAALLPGEAPFVELPIGATEDRVVGTLDLAVALTGGEKRFEPGLLHAAHGGVLYVDEINLLPDHLVDVLLDVAASGVNRIEREGVSHAHPSRFVLIGSMNPEEGDLRPQLLDRFGLAVDVRTPVSGDERTAALRRRLAFDADPGSVADAFAADERDVAARLASFRPATLPEEIVEAVAGLCAAAGAEGLRADLTICRAASALAGWEGRRVVGPSDVRRVAPLALAHRARRDPLDHSGHDEQRLEEALDEHLGPEPGAGGDDGGEPAESEPPGSGPPESEPTGSESPGSESPGPESPAPWSPGSESSGSGSSRPDQVAAPAPAVAPSLPTAGRRQVSGATGRGAPTLGRRGRVIGARIPDGPVSAVAVGATVRQAAARRAGRPDGADAGALVERSDIREAVREHRTANLIVIAVDASGSMGAAQRMETAKGAVIALLRDAYQRRDLVSLVSFRGDGADVLLRPTSSVEVARARLTDLPTGGRTPLAAGLRTALQLATAPGRAVDHRPLIVLITDARATSGPDGGDPFETATAVAGDVRRSGVPSLVIDVEAAGNGLAAPRLGLAARLAEAMGASYVPLSELTAAAVEQTVRAAALR
ncbi:MAG TPA: ATP-binding protein [Acidimicrobiales bacterium]|nr:ATP-binding protein [Acidimicrobiales bacterium]